MDCHLLLPTFSIQKYSTRNEGFPFGFHFNSERHYLKKKWFVVNFIYRLTFDHQLFSDQINILYSYLVLLCYPNQAVFISTKTLILDTTMTGHNPKKNIILNVNCIELDKTRSKVLIRCNLPLMLILNWGTRYIIH